jgi:hypothetical protein
MVGIGCRALIHGNPHLTFQFVQRNSHQLVGILIESAVNHCQNEIVQIGSQVNGKICHSTLPREGLLGILRAVMHLQRQSSMDKVRIETVGASCGRSADFMFRKEER